MATISVNGTGTIPVVIQQPPDLITQIFTQPYIWIAIIVGIIAFVIIKRGQGTKRPEQGILWGVKFRGDVTKAEVKKRMKVWGKSFNYTMYKGFNKMAKAMKLEMIDRKIQKQDAKGIIEVNHQYYHITFREFGFFAWLKANLLGKFEHIIVDPAICNIDYANHKIILHPKAYFINDGGVWVLPTSKETQLIDEINWNIQLQDIKGFTADYLRRLSNEAPLQAMSTEKMQHASELEEKAKQNRLKRFADG